MKRDPARPKAADIPLADLLVAIFEHSGGGPWIMESEPLKRYPAKVVFARLHKLIDQGLVCKYPFALTAKGKEALNG